MTITPSQIPVSKAAMIATKTKEIKEQWAHTWLSSSKCRFLKTFDKSPPSGRLQKIYNNLSRPEASILTQLRTSHIGLNAHLFRVKASVTPLCSICEVPETVSHYLLACRRYNNERAALQLATKLRDLQLRELLSIHSKHIAATLSFVKASRRFPTIFQPQGVDEPPEVTQDSQRDLGPGYLGHARGELVSQTNSPPSTSRAVR